MHCDQQDYVEIACMYHYPVELLLKAGDIITGKALDTTLNKMREECIKLQTDNGEVLVVLDGVSKLKVTIKNPHFIEVNFS